MREKFHAEVDPIMYAVEDDVIEKFTYEMTEDLWYVKCCYNEVMRYDTPFPAGSPITVTEPVTIDGCKYVPNG